ncbi:MAG: acid shock protein [Ruminococcus sp.]|nr:acid shock protein [Ruminococcus sp.]
MKKFLAIMLAALMVLSLAACGTESNNESKPDSSAADTTAAEAKDLDIDMSKYPADINEWTGKDVAGYFTDAGVFSNGNGVETWNQDHATYWPGTPVTEAVGCWDDAETFSITVLVLGKDNADSSEEQYNEWKTNIKEKKDLPGEFSGIPMEHMIGNLVFSYETSILDDDMYNAMTDAYNYLVKALNITPEL